MGVRSSRTLFVSLAAGDSRIVCQIDARILTRGRPLSHVQEADDHLR
jgi:hypothetical protein